MPALLEEDIVLTVASEEKNGGDAYEEESIKVRDHLSTIIEVPEFSNDKTNK